MDDSESALDIKIRTEKAVSYPYMRLDTCIQAIIRI